MAEKCALCGAPVAIDEHTPIDERPHYIEGAGQLCWHCYQSLYTEDSPEAKSERKVVQRMGELALEMAKGCNTELYRGLTEMI